MLWSTLSKAFDISNNITIDNCLLSIASNNMSIICGLFDVLYTDSMRLCRIFLTNMTAVKSVDYLKRFQDPLPCVAVLLLLSSTLKDMLWIFNKLNIYLIGTSVNSNTNSFTQNILMILIWISLVYFLSQDALIVSIKVYSKHYSKSANIF
jgi:hypothetical protein